MELYLQFGHGMMEHTRRLIDEWGGGTVILSPRDLDDRQIVKLAADIHRLGGNVWIDPQVYLPRADHYRLVEHDYWPSDYATSMLTDRQALDSMFERLKHLNNRAKSGIFIIPGLYGDQIDDDWLAVHENLIAASTRICKDYSRFATVCISNTSLRDEEEIEVLLNSCENWDVDGFYVVPEHPDGDYLVEDPLWLTNLLHLTCGLRLLEKRVVIGYCNHQMLSLAVANVEAICSGTWLNVRSFSLSRFQNPDTDSTSRRTLWYYCPQTLSEFKLPFLDMGHSAGILDEMRPTIPASVPYSDMLFTGAQPTSTAYNEKTSFRHYLHALHNQVTASNKSTYKETLNYQFAVLDNAENLLNRLKKHGVRGQQRDFSDIIDVNRAALTRFDSIRGFVMERKWQATGSK
ncbi:MAG: hypothetical protein KC449_15815 [Anaerolineales bacterium]|nr:hypothetical protein [Anaerolineales bacterium]